MPPLWLLGCLAAAYAQDRLAPVGPEAPGALRLLAGALVVAGVAATALAARQFHAAQTTIVPHQAPKALVTGGIYRLSRNPIYLADLALLIGAILWWGAWPSLILAPLFAWVITQRFIRPEEKRLAAAFPQAFCDYVAQTRRWL